MAAEVSFANMKVPDLWKSLKGRDIQISVNGKSRKQKTGRTAPKLEKETVQSNKLISSMIELLGEI